MWGTPAWEGSWPRTVPAGQRRVFRVVSQRTRRHGVVAEAFRRLPGGQFRRFGIVPVLIDYQSGSTLRALFARVDLGVGRPVWGPGRHVCSTCCSRTHRAAISLNAAAQRGARRISRPRYGRSRSGSVVWRNRLPSPTGDEHPERDEVTNGIGETDHSAANRRFAARPHGNAKSQARSLHRAVGWPGEAAVDLGGTSRAKKQSEDIGHRHCQGGFVGPRIGIQDSSF